jgi:TorA maturation chaperone TorD
MPTPGERLRLAAALLGAPGEDGAEELAALAGEHRWLAAAAAEIAGLPLDEWRAEHGRLFIGTGPATPCLPFESAQLQGTMCGPSTARVAAIYEQLGLTADGLPADYLGSMLECAAFLADTAVDARAARRLWQDHLRKWLPAFGEKLQVVSDLQLYRLLGREYVAICSEIGHD